MVNQKGQVFLKLKKERKLSDNQKSQAKLIAYDLQTGARVEIETKQGQDQEEEQFTYARKV